MVNLKSPILVLFALFALASCSSTSGPAEIKDYGYDTLSLRVGLQSPSVPLLIEATDDEDDSEERSLDYNPNPSPKLGAGVDWGDFGVYLSFLSLSPSTSVEEIGKTKYFDLQFHIYAGKFGVDLYWQDFKGYHLRNTEDVMPEYYEENGNLIRSDLRSFFAGFNLIYVLRPERLSFGAAINNTSTQSTSGGSLYFLASYSDQRLSSDGTLAPVDLAETYGEMGNIKKAKFQTASLGGGYGYTWIFSNPWYLHGSVSLSLGPQLQDYSTQDYGKVKTWKAAAKGNGRLSFGYSGERFFSGLSLIGDSTNFQIEDRVLQFNSIFSSLYLGVRLGVL